MGLLRMVILHCRFPYYCLEDQQSQGKSFLQTIKVGMASKEFERSRYDRVSRCILTGFGICVVVDI